MNNPDDELNRILADLGRSPRLEPSAGLLRRVAEIPVRHPRAVKVRSGRARLWAWGMAGAFAMALGALNGWLITEQVPEASYAEEDWNELSALALAENYEGDWE